MGAPTKTLIKPPTALFFDPYLDSLGGGERYFLTLASLLSNRGWQVTIVWNDPDILKLAHRKFHLSFKNVSFLPLRQYQPLISRTKSLYNFDFAFAISDGSIPLLIGARQQIIHLQVPFHDLGSNNWKNKLKLKFISSIVTNSEFTKDFIDSEYGVNSVVVYPPVDVNAFSALPKRNEILYVGRFSNLLQSKGHLQLIKAFKSLYDSGVTNYRLWLAGSTEIGSDELITQLRSAVAEYPIEILTNPKFKDLQELYGRARFFWSLTGLDANEATQPEKCEHFGMTLVEAMAAGCVPLVIEKGGFREVVENSQSGILVSNLSQLVSQTRLLLKNPTKTKLLSQNAVLRAKNFSTDQFSQSFSKIIENF